MPNQDVGTEEAISTTVRHWKVHTSVKIPAPDWMARANCPMQGAKENLMTTIKINDLNDTRTVRAEEAADVKGGPVYMKLGDIKGNVTRTVPSEQISLNYEEIK